MKTFFSGVLGFGIGFVLKEVFTSIIVHEAYDHGDVKSKQILENYRDEGEKIETLFATILGDKSAAEDGNNSNDGQAEVVNFDGSAAEQN